MSLVPRTAVLAPMRQAGSLYASLVYSKESFSNGIIYCSFAIWLFASVLDTSLLSSYLHMNITSLACVGLLVLAEVIKGYETRVGHYALAATLLFLVAALGAMNVRTVCAVAFIFSVRDIPFRRMAQISLLIMSIAFAMVIILMLLGVIQNYVELGQRGRRYLGFRYSLFPAQLFFAMTCLVLFLRGDKLTYLEAAGLIAANYIIFSFTNSRLSFGLSVVAIVAALVIQYRRLRNLKQGVLLQGLVSVYVLGALSILLAVLLFDPAIDWWAYIDSILGKRLSLASSALSKYGVPLFGQEIEFIGNGLDHNGLKSEGAYNYVDMLYILLAVKYGIVALVLFVVLSTRACYRCLKADQRYLLLVLGLIGLHCLIDDLCMYLYYNPFLLLLAANHIPKMEAIAQSRNKKNQFSLF